MGPLHRRSRSGATPRQPNAGPIAFAKHAGSHGASQGSHAEVWQQARTRRRSTHACRRHSDGCLELSGR
eukprot:9192567-Prorocentrum_lima.AAC.1